MSFFTEVSLWALERLTHCLRAPWHQRGSCWSFQRQDPDVPWCPFSFTPLVKVTGKHGVVEWGSRASEKGCILIHYRHLSMLQIILSQGKTKSTRQGYNDDTIQSKTKPCNWCDSEAWLYLPLRRVTLGKLFNHPELWFLIFKRQITITPVLRIKWSVASAHSHRCPTYIHTFIHVPMCTVPAWTWHWDMVNDQCT